jgi:hypothetical protein
MTKMGMKRDISKRRKPINKMSQLTISELKEWHLITNARKTALQDKYDYIPCEYCKERIILWSELYCAEGHHNNHNRRDNTYDNCRILHRVCNQQIEDLNVKDVPSLLNGDDKDDN